jgi:ADP-ribosylglycohydrolase
LQKLSAKLHPTRRNDMTTKARAMVLASFAADSLALGAHWIYNTNIIDKKWGRVESYIKPERPTYHPNKDLGEFTHYGDQTLLLLQSLADNSGFDFERFAQQWQNYFKTYGGYFDGATKQTLENFAAGEPAKKAGSHSDDLAGASRIAPLAYYYRRDLQAFLTSARDQTALTHNNHTVIESAEFFGRVTWKVLNGESPTAALQQTVDEGFDRKPYTKWIENGLNSATKDTRQTILEFGQMCEIQAGFPSVIHLIAKYENSLKDGLVENVMAGGDSAGRGLMVGMILGAYGGLDAIPQKWLTELKAMPEIVKRMDQMDQQADPD